MADVTNIELYGERYNIKDANARSNISSLQGDVTSIQGNVTTLQGNVTTLQGNVSTLQGNVTNLQTNLHKAEIKSDILNGKIVCIGDSYLAGMNPGGQTVTPWGTYLRNYLNKSSDGFNFADSGCGFYATGDRGKNFASLLQEAVASTSFDNNDVSLIIIGGGFNDARVDANLDQILNGVRSCANVISQNFPNAQTLVAFISNVQSPANNVNYGQFYRTLQNYWLCTGITNMAFLDNIGQTLKVANGGAMSSDGVHPTELGEQLIAMSLKNYLMNGNSIGVVSNHYYADSDSVWCLSDRNNVIIDWAVPKAYDFEATSITLDGSHSILERDWTALHINPFFGTGNLCFMIDAIVVGSGNYYDCKCKMNIQSNGYVKFYPICVADDHSGYVTTNATRLYVHNQTISIPRILV